MALRITCDTDAKKQNREQIKNYILQTKDSTWINNAKVLCLPGWEAIEIYQIWDPIGIKRSNIYAVTNEAEDAEKLKQVKNINIIIADAYQPQDFLANLSMSKLQRNLKYIRSQGEKAKRDLILNRSLFDIIYLDFYGNMGWKQTILGLYTDYLKDNGIFGLTWYASRETWKKYNEKLEQVINEFPDDETAEAKINLTFTILSDLFLSPYHRAIAFKSTEQAVRSISKCEKHGVLSILPFGGKATLSGILKEWNELSDGVKGEVVKFIRQNARYLTSCLKTRYVANRSPMATIMTTTRRLSHYQSNADSMRDFILSNYYKGLPVPLIHIKQEEREPHQDRPAVKEDISCPAINKDEAIQLLREFKTKEDMEEIAKITGCSMGTLRALKAHITMVTY